MQAAYASLPPCFPARPLRGALASVKRAGGAAQDEAGRKLDCGWFDSSFDLARGLDVMEQDNDALFQLWQLARR